MHAARTVIAIGLAAGLLSACGGGSDPSSLAAVPTSSSAAPTPESTTPEPTATTESATPTPTPSPTKASARPSATKASPKPTATKKATTAPKTDKRYSTCTKAKAAGLGPYYEGKDPEYDWYDDRDHDGIVCE